MEVHSAHAQSIQAQIDALKAMSEKRPVAETFTDPIREFHRASSVVGTVRNWLTLSIKERERIVAEGFNYFPKQENERIEEYEVREQERWRALCVIIQEESRSKPPNQSIEAAKIAFKKLFPAHEWAKKG